MTIDRRKLQAFVDRTLGDIGSLLTAGLVVLGDQLGLYRAMADGELVTSDELAARTDTAERPVREWLAAQAAAGYVDYDAVSGRYRLPAEQALVLTDDASPVCTLGGFQAMVAALLAVPRVREAFRSGAGVGWGDHDPDLFAGVERFFRPAYATYLARAWIPALDGVEARLRAGARVADVGCGRGVSTVIMATAYPGSTFVGFDPHEPSLAAGRARAEAKGVGARCRFERASAQDYPGVYELVTTFDCLHDMGDPVAAAAHVRRSLAAGGTWMLVEPFAGDRVEENLTPAGRIYYGASTLVCTQAALAEGADDALGAQAGEMRLRAVVGAAGFTRVRRAAVTPFNLVLEVRP